MQIDVKFVEPLPAKAAADMPATKPVGRRGEFYQFTAIDDCSRLRTMRVYPRNNQKTVIQFIDNVLSQLPFQIETIQTDNGAEFQSGLHWHVLDTGINHVYFKLRTHGGLDGQTPYERLRQKTQSESRV